jgi:two-component system NtrC family sensor kinase
MTAHLQLAQDELYHLASSLETKVAERTRELQQMQSQLVRSEKLASLGELVAGIAHEINNPLTGILVFANLLHEDARLHPELQADLSVIQRETQRCSAIVQRLLAFSREAPPQKKRLSLHPLLDNTLQLLENQPSFKNIQLVRDYAPDLPAIEVDEGQLSQVFMNILLNALQAMPDGGSLKLQTMQVGERVEIVITDTGCGMEEAQLARIFDPFYTTKPTGTGLGLSVSYGIIEGHGGNIRVESKVGQGTQIWIELPIEGASLPDEPPN